jgi:uncharacterized protein (TIGR03435 family)
MRLNRFVVLLSATGLIGAAQSPPRPEFEVASIKPTFGDMTFVGTNRSADFRAREASMRRLIADAYAVRTFEIYGGPGWMDSERYNIDAKREVNPKRPQTGQQSFETIWADMLLRLQTLLEDRCKLKFHRETRELPVYALTVAKGGLKVLPPTCVTVDLANSGSSPASRLPPGAFCGSLQSVKNGANMVTTGAGVDTKDLIHYWLSVTAGRTVIDKTGYTEKFNFSVEWAPDAAFSPSLAGTDDSIKPADAAGPSLSSALEEKLGLILKATKGPVEVFVIDHIEKPSAN